MTSDLPFDSNDTEADDRAGDTAYRIATGVARVARAGAYVTGGALVASNGGGAPTHPGSQRLDSWHTGWAAGSSDPEPDAPSPVVTFPEPDPHSIPAPPLARDGHHGFQLPSFPTAPAAPNGHAPSNGPYIRVGAPEGHTPSTPNWSESTKPNWSESGNTPTLHVPSTTEWGNPTPQTPAPSGPPGLPLPEWHVPNWWDAITGKGEKSEDDSSDNGPGVGLPGHGPSGHGFGIPDGGGLVPPGNVFGLTRAPVAESMKVQAVSDKATDTVLGHVYGESQSAVPGHVYGESQSAVPGHVYGESQSAVPGHASDESQSAVPGHMFDETPNAVPGHMFDGMFGDYLDGMSDGASGHLFDGVGNGDFGVYLGVQAGVQVHTEFDLDVSIGPKGAYVSADLKVEASAGLKVVGAAGSNVGDQVDRFNDWLDHGGHGTYPASPSGRATADQQGSGSGTSGLGNSGVGHQPVAPAVAPPALSTVAAQPIAPVPAPIAPPAPVVNVAQPVAATPLQTTIQPDAASTPIANVLAPPPGPSPLTAPAAVLPALFDQPVQPIPVKPVVDLLPTLTPVPTATLPTISTTITHTLPTPGNVITDPGTMELPDLGTTKLPTAVLTPTPGAGTGIDVTKTPGLPGTQTPGTTVVPTRPTTPDDDITLPSTGGGAGTGHTGPSTPTQPSTEIPTVVVPTQQPSLPQPTVSHAAPAPTIIPITPTMDVELPTAQNPLPTGAGPVTPIKPPMGLDPKPHGIAGELDDPMSVLLSHTDPSMYYDHSAYTLMAAGGLATPLMSEASMQDAHHLLPGGLDGALL
ncbi:hypothetical protein [Nocardia sp. NPDC057440]|uniref:hypothetical protein n=1 Tax=Nocardia sp. NPDC057440 TaxID=3346134 RepID=UPI00366E9820